MPKGHRQITLLNHKTLYLRIENLYPMNLFVGKLPDSVNGAVLEALFSRYGEVDSARVMYDRHTNESKHFGFVEIQMKKKQKRL